jgi:hypothetical protein
MRVKQRAVSTAMGGVRQPEEQLGDASDYGIFGGTLMRLKSPSKGFRIYAGFSKSIALKYGAVCLKHWWLKPPVQSCYASPPGMPRLGSNCASRDDLDKIRLSRLLLSREF